MLLIKKKNKNVFKAKAGIDSNKKNPPENPRVDNSDKYAMRSVDSNNSNNNYYFNKSADYKLKVTAQKSDNTKKYVNSPLEKNLKPKFSMKHPKSNKNISNANKNLDPNPNIHRYSKNYSKQATTNKSKSKNNTIADFSLFSQNKNFKLKSAEKYKAKGLIDIYGLVEDKSKKSQLLGSKFSDHRTTTFCSEDADKLNTNEKNVKSNNNVNNQIQSDLAFHKVSSSIIRTKNNFQKEFLSDFEVEFLKIKSSKSMKSDDLNNQGSAPLNQFYFKKLKNNDQENLNLLNFDFNK